MTSPRPAITSRSCLASRATSIRGRLGRDPARGARHGGLADSRRHPDGHQHAGHGRHRGHRAAGRRRSRRAAVVMMSVQGEADYLRRSMLAGAREFLVKPFSSDELTASIRQVYARERDKLSRMAVPSPVAPTGSRRRCVDERRATASPAGSSRSSAPRAASAERPSRSTWRSRRPPSSARRSCLVDGSFQFGDVGVLLNLNPKNKSIADLIPELEAGELESLDTFVINHTVGRPRPARAAVPGDGRADHAGRPSQGPRDACAPNHDLVVVDCTAYLQRHDAGDPRHRPMSILTMLSLEITSIKNMRLFLEVAESARLRDRQGPPRPQPRRLGARHPRRRTSSTRSAARSTRRSSATAGASSTRSTGAYRSSCPTGRRRSPRTSFVWLASVTWRARVAAGTATTSRKSTQKKSLFAWR